MKIHLSVIVSGPDLPTVTRVVPIDDLGTARDVALAVLQTVSVGVRDYLRPIYRPDAGCNPCGSD